MTAFQAAYCNNVLVIASTDSRGVLRRTDQLQVNLNLVSCLQSSWLKCGTKHGAYDGNRTEVESLATL